MMRPDNSHKQDIIDSLLEKSWENPPAQLEHQLRAIPAQITFAQSRNLDRFSLVLNAILLLWGMGLVTYFWTPLYNLISTTSQALLSFSASSQHMLAHPFVGIIVLLGLLIGWVWMDLAKQPGTT